MLATSFRSMRLVLLLAAVAATMLSVVGAQANDTPDVNIQTTFPNNPFSRAANGQANRVVFTLTQPKSGADADRLLTLESITGAYLNRDKIGKRGYVMKNMTTTKYKSLPLKTKDGKPLQVPYDFFPEFKPQQVGVEFRVIVNDQQTSKKHNLAAYTGSITIYEPPKSWFDLQLMSLYLLLAAIFGSTIYWASQNYPGSKSISKRKQRKSNMQSTSSTAGTTGAAGTKGQYVAPAAADKGKSSATGYDEDWIPKHHLKQPGSGTSSPRPRAGRTASGRG